MKKYHIEFIRLVGEGVNHEHIHLADTIVEENISAKDIMSQMSVEIYECDDDGVMKNGGDMCNKIL